MGQPSCSYAPSRPFARSERRDAYRLDVPPLSPPGYLHLCGLGAPVKDAGAGPAQHAANSGELPVALPAVLATLEPGLGRDQDFVDAVLGQAKAIQQVT
jgi:hypothetical protein